VRTSAAARTPFPRSPKPSCSCSFDSRLPYLLHLPSTRPQDPRDAHLLTNQLLLVLGFVSQDDICTPLVLPPFDRPGSFLYFEMPPLVVPLPRFSTIAAFRSSCSIS